MNRTAKRIAGVLAIAALLTACSAGATSPGTTSVAAVSSPSPTSGSAEYVADVDIGGRTLHIVCVGPTDTGLPTVIFEAGLTGDLYTWGDVMTALTPTHRACSYDRAGDGGSPPAQTPRTTSDQVADLHALLAGAGVAPPYVLVGFSIGGWNAMVYTDAYPSEVAGAVLVDVRPPQASREWLAALPPEAPDDSEALKGNREELTVFEHDPSLNSEGLDLVKSADEAMETAGFGDRPLIVLSAADTADQWEGLETGLATRLDTIGKDLQARLATLSTQGRQVLVTDTGHHIPSERPDAILDAIEEVLGQIGS
jgi:pimeloyl-ACP methyl ester carboxylesterase